MSQHAIFEEFEAVATVSQGILSDAEFQKQIRAAFDNGYKQGWSDAIMSAEAEREKALTDIAVALQEAGFTYFEARAHILKSFQPLLNCLVDSILPEIAKASLGPKIVEELLKLYDGIERPVEILCCPDDEADIRAIVEGHTHVPLTISPEQTLSSAQVALRFDDGHAAIDLEATLSKISSLVTEFYAALDDMEKAHA